MTAPVISLGGGGSLAGQSQELLPELQGYPSPGRSRSLLMAAEQLTLEAQRHRADALENGAWAQLAQSEAALLVEIQGLMPGADNIDVPLRQPLDSLANGLRALLGDYRREEAQQINDALRGLAHDLLHTHSAEASRTKDLLTFSREQAAEKLEVARRAADAHFKEAMGEQERKWEARLQEAVAQAVAEAEEQRARDAPTIVPDTLQLLEERVTAAGTQSEEGCIFLRGRLSCTET